MKSIVAGVLASIAALGLLSACGGDDPVASVATDSIPTEVTFPTGVSIPTDLSIPTDAIPSGTIPQALIDTMVAQFEAAGMNVDKDCFTKLLSDESLRNLVSAGGAPSQEVMQKFFSCIKT